MNSFLCFPPRRSGNGVLTVALALASVSLLASNVNSAEPDYLVREKTSLEAAQAATASSEVHRFTNTEVNRADINAALDRLDSDIELLEARIEAIKEPMIKQRLKELKERRNALSREFRTASYDALVTDVQTEWSQLAL